MCIFLVDALRYGERVWGSNIQKPFTWFSTQQSDAVSLDDYFAFSPIP